LQNFAGSISKWELLLDDADLSCCRHHKQQFTSPKVRGLP
jgi:hypothetical protein